MKNITFKSYWLIPILSLLFIRQLSDWEYTNMNFFKNIVSMFIMFENVAAVIFLLLYFKVLPL